MTVSLAGIVTEGLRMEQVQTGQETCELDDDRRLKVHECPGAFATMTIGLQSMSRACQVK